MRGGMLIACHHGLVEAQLDYIHEQAHQFLRQFR